VERSPRRLLNALANGKRLRRLIFAHSATIGAVVFGEADPPLMRRARDTRSRDFGLAGTPIRLSLRAGSAATKVGAIDLNRPRAGEPSLPFSVCRKTTTPRTRSRVIEFYCGLCGGTAARLRLW
jgi:hypothetical protein